MRVATGRVVTLRNACFGKRHVRLLTVEEADAVAAADTTPTAA